jgi:hypothetical protein
MDVWEQMSSKTGMKQWNKGPRLKEAAMSRRREDIQQDLQEGCRAGYREVKGQTLRQDLENECQDIVEGSAPFETKEETQHRNVGTPTTLGSFAYTDRKRKMMVINLD